MCLDCPTHLEVCRFELDMNDPFEDEDLWEDEAFYASDEEE